MNTNGDLMEVHGYLVMEFDGISSREFNREDVHMGVNHQQYSTIRI